MYHLSFQAASRERISLSDMPRKMTYKKDTTTSDDFSFSSNLYTSSGLDDLGKPGLSYEEVKITSRKTQRRHSRSFRNSQSSLSSRSTEESPPSYPELPIVSHLDTKRKVVMPPSTQLTISSRSQPQSYPTSHTDTIHKVVPPRMLPSTQLRVSSRCPPIHWNSSIWR